MNPKSAFKHTQFQSVSIKTTLFHPVTRIIFLLGLGMLLCLLWHYKPWERFENTSGMCCMLPYCESNIIQSPQPSYVPGNMLLTLPDTILNPNKDSARTYALNILSKLVKNGKISIRIDSTLLDSIEYSMVDSCICNTSIYRLHSDILIGQESGLAHHNDNRNGKVSPDLIFSIDETQFPKKGIIDTNNIVRPTEPSEVGKVVAFLDTGVDRFSSAFVHFKKSVDYGLDHDYGINMIQPNNSISDASTHGTQMIETFEHTLVEMMYSGLPLDLLAIKVLGEDGYGSSFDLACGLYCADNEGAEIINLSLGAYDTSIVVLDAIEHVTRNEDVQIICSAGNRGLNLHYNVHFPSCLAISNEFVYEVGGVCKSVEKICNNKMNAMWPGSNYRDDMFVQNSFKERNNLHDPKSKCIVAGTSYSAAIMSALVTERISNYRPHIGLKTSIDVGSKKIKNLNLNGHDYNSYFFDRCQ